MVRYARVLREAGLLDDEVGDSQPPDKVDGTGNRLPDD